ncbi:hypothetical protein WMF38_10385 [Sorangium sp. So ce118]
MTGDTVKVLETSRDPKELLAAALATARSDQPADHEVLRQHLQRDEFLRRLDSEQDYKEAARFWLRVSRVLEALGSNPLPSAHKALLTLTADKVFLAEGERIIALIQAGAKVRPAPAELVKFWDAHSQPEDGFTPTTITALVTNGSAPALALLETKLADPGHEDDDKLAWMRSDMLAHRNDLPLLERCERMLKGSLPRALRPSLVEVLFDYRPGEWFSPATVVSAPDLRKATPEALAELLKIGELALKSVPLSATQKKAVELRVEEIKKLLP